MQELMYRLVERLLTDRESMSRNKNFAAFEEPRMKRAVRIARHLRTLQEDVLQWGPQGCVSARRVGQRVHLEVDYAGRRDHRLASISLHELELMCLDPEVAAILKPLLERPVEPAPEQAGQAP